MSNSGAKRLKSWFGRNVGLGVVARNVFLFVPGMGLPSFL
jgi:hypothetical protein